MAVESQALAQGGAAVTTLYSTGGWEMANCELNVVLEREDAS